jgi:hypothetical protein
MENALMAEIIKAGTLGVMFAGFIVFLLKGTFITRKHHEDVCAQIGKVCASEREQKEYFRAAFERSDQRFASSVDVTHQVIEKVVRQ